MSADTPHREIRHHFVKTNGITMHVAESGQGPAVVMCHGFPELWYSWRHQIVALANAGYRAIAPDMRGYGQTERPEQTDQYTMLHLVGDMVGLLNALDVPSATIIGHDWGAPVAWTSALLRPDRFRAVVGFSLPFVPRGTAPPTTFLPQDENEIFYQLYFQEPGRAESELERNARNAVGGILCWESANSERPRPTPGAGGVGMVRRNGGYLDGKQIPAQLPPWLGTQDLDYFANAFEKTGFRGGLNWYRNMDRNWELLAPWSGARVTVPAFYIGGDADEVLGIRDMDWLLDAQQKFVPNHRGSLIIPDCGHWIQQEQPETANDALIDFLDDLPQG